MNEYSARIEAALLRSRESREAAAAADCAAAEHRQRDRDALVSLLSQHARPEFAKACTAVIEAGFPASVELGEVWQSHLGHQVVRLRLAAGTMGTEHVLELRGTGPHSPATARRLSPGQDTLLGSCEPGPQLRDFSRDILVRFLDSIPFTS